MLLEGGNDGELGDDPLRGPIHLRAELGDSPEVGVPLQPPLPGQPAQWPSLASGLGRSGMRRTPTPNRKIVAAISPTEIPHSTSDGR